MNTQMTMKTPQEPGLLRLAGFFTFKARDVRTGRIRNLANFRNLILNAGLERLGTSNLDPGYCQVGSGTTTPANNQTVLTTYVGGTARTSQSEPAYVGGSPPYIARVYTFQFATGAVVGNLSEVGVGWAPSGAALFSRALILDSFGVPTTLTILSTEALIVTYELRNYPNVADSVVTMDIGGVSTTVTIRPSQISGGSVWTMQPLTSGFTANNVADYNGDIGDVFSTPSGTSVGGANATLIAYSANSRYRDMQISWGPSAGLTPGGVKSITFGLVGGLFQAGFSPPLVKTNTQTRILTFRFPWART